MPRRHQHARSGFRARVTLALAAFLVIGLGAAPAVGAESAYQMDLGRRSDFVAQTNLVQCVGASTQMMLNMMESGADRTASTQVTLQRVARGWSGPRPDGRERRGASVYGWAAALTMFGGGRYEVVGGSTIDEALLIAARAMRTTGRPVGLLMWRGRHAWVMSGFRATRDPLLPGARVTSVIVEDPLYPRDSRTWGRSPAPGSRLTVAQLGRQFVRRRTSSQWIQSIQLSGKYVVVIPFQDPRRHRLEF